MGSGGKVAVNLDLWQGEAGDFSVFQRGEFGGETGGLIVFGVDRQGELRPGARGPKQGIYGIWADMAGGESAGGNDAGIAVCGDRDANGEVGLDRVAVDFFAHRLIQHFTADIGRINRPDAQPGQNGAAQASARADIQHRPLPACVHKGARRVDVQLVIRARGKAIVIILSPFGIKPYGIARGF